MAATVPPESPATAPAPRPLRFLRAVTACAKAAPAWRTPSRRAKRPCGKVSLHPLRPGRVELAGQRGEYQADVQVVTMRQQPLEDGTADGAQRAEDEPHVCVSTRFDGCASTVIDGRLRQPS